ncbi:hypothetical protein Tco_0942493 [Tanacetum coccineum]
MNLRYMNWKQIIITWHRFKSVTPETGDNNGSHLCGIRFKRNMVILISLLIQKEETFQVIIDVIKNSTHFKAFIISAEVPEIFMQQFWYTIKKIQGTNSYEFVLANKRCVVDAEVFRKILDICPRVEGEEFTEVQDDDATLTFLIDLGYKGPLHEHTNMFYRENVNYPELI